MNAKKIIALTAAVGTLVLGVVMLAYAIADKEFSQPLMAAFFVLSIANSVMLMTGARKK